MTIYEYGDTNADNVLIQPVDDHDFSLIEHEAELIQEMTRFRFHLIAVKVDSWNDDLSPWKAPAVFGDVDFGGNAEKTLAQILELTTHNAKTYYIGGYSLAGLFALWAVCNTDVFSGVAAASPSVWFPEFTSYLKAHETRTQSIYLSLGEREEKTKHPVMATVGDRIRECYAHLQKIGIECTMEWNKGNHFKDANLRTAKAFAWLINHT